MAGCATKGYQKASSTASYLEATSQRIAKSTGQIDAATAALATLVDNLNADLKLQFKNYSSAVNALEASARDAAARATNIQHLGSTYLEQWDKNLATIQNEDIREKSAERKAEVQKKFDRAKANYEQAIEDLKPLLTDLRDIRTALSTDLTPAGVEAISRSMTSVNSHATKVRKALSDLAAHLQDLAKSLEVPTPPPPKEAPAGES